MTIILDGTSGITNSSWTTAGRPATPATGQQGYNTTTGTWEAYSNSGWQPLNTSIVTNYQQFTASGTFTVPAGVKLVQVLVVGGGGGGWFGGGGAGGVLFIPDYIVTPLGSITVGVGAGGAAVANGGASQWDTHQLVWGGGRGGTNDTVFGSPNGPQQGASGGGGGATSTVIGAGAPGSSQGSSGGSAPTISPYPAGGGGGASQVGGNGAGTTSGNGGTGVYFQMFVSYGQTGWFGGGGGGGYATFGVGGLGGGGAGAVAGTANTGGGGGGNNGAGAAGGSGTVIVSWYQ